MKSENSPRIHSINASSGGVPKLPINRAGVTRLGIIGDEQRHKRFHGGPQRALCLYALELIERLRCEGHLIFPGAVGENITTIGLEWSRVTPGAQLHLGDEVVIEIMSYTVPCKTIAPYFINGKFARISQRTHPGEARVYASVVVEGRITVGDSIRFIE